MQEMTAFTDITILDIEQLYDFESAKQEEQLLHHVYIRNLPG